jgi:hypothetical protein
MNLPTQHLSDEAVAACADGVLGATANARAQRHIAVCAECAQAVDAQREVARQLRTAPLPSLPNGLLDRLRAVPITTPLPNVDVSLGADGAPMFRTAATSRRAERFGVGMAAAAFVPAQPRVPGQPTAQPSNDHQHHLRRHFGLGALTAALVLTVGSAAAGAAIVDYRDHSTPSVPANMAPAVVANHAEQAATFAGLSIH